MKKTFLLVAALMVTALVGLKAQDEPKVSIPSGYRAFIEEENSLQLVSATTLSSASPPPTAST